MHARYNSWKQSYFEQSNYYTVYVLVAIVMPLPLDTSGIMFWVVYPSVYPSA